MLGHKQHPIGQIPNFTHVEIFMIPPKMRNWQNSMAIKLTAYFLFKKQQSQNLVISRFAGWLTKFVTTLDSMIIPFQTPGTTTCLTVDHHHLTFLVDFILEVHAPVFAVPLFFTCASCKILQPSTINHQQTITQPQNPETHSLHPFRIFRIFQIQGTRLLVLASLGGVSVPPLPGRGSHPGNTVGTPKDTAGGRELNDSMAGKKNTVFRRSVLCVCTCFCVLKFLRVKK
jgi:hypothetical protein